MSWQEPKTSWNSEDYYNFEDLNRVENNTKIVAGLVKLFDRIPDLETNTNRDMSSIEFAESLNRIENNIKILGERRILPGWISPKMDWEYNQRFSYVDANRLEKNLKLLYEYYKGNSELFKYCGAYTCGEEVI
jgi:hypothetical protein